METALARRMNRRDVIPAVATESAPHVDRVMTRTSWGLRTLIYMAQSGVQERLNDFRSAVDTGVESHPSRAEKPAMEMVPGAAVDLVSLPGSGRFA